MKKLLLFAAVTVICFSTVQSQELRLGAKAGVNFASIGGDETDDFDGRTSFHVGALVEIPISQKFAVQPELLYSSQGAKEEYSSIPFGGFGIKYENKLKLDYINIPIMAKYYISDGLSIEAGPQFGILISAKAEGEVSELQGGEVESFDQDVKDSFKSLDIGFGLGAAYRLNNNIFFSARYILGINDIAEDIEYNGSIEVKTFNQHNNVFQLSAGYSF